LPRSGCSSAPERCRSWWTHAAYRCQARSLLPLVSISWRHLRPRALNSAAHQRSSSPRIGAAGLLAAGGWARARPLLPRLLCRP